MLSFRLFVGFLNFSCATEALYYSSPSPDYSDRKFQLYAFLYQLFVLPCYHPILPSWQLVYFQRLSNYLYYLCSKHCSYKANPDD